MINIQSWIKCIGKGKYYTEKRYLLYKIHGRFSRLGYVWSYSCSDRYTQILVFFYFYQYVFKKTGSAIFLFFSYRHYFSFFNISHISSISIYVCACIYIYIYIYIYHSYHAIYIYIYIYAWLCVWLSRIVKKTMLKYAIT